MNQEQLSYLQLNTPKIGSRTLLKLHKTYGSYCKANKLVQAGKAPELSAEQRASLRPATQQNELEQKIRKEGIGLVFLGDPEYPELLSQIPDPPAALYYKGKLPNTVTLSIVGTRTVSSYGLQTTELLAKTAYQLQLNVVSGLALGIDGQAHKTVVKEQGSTVAVLPCGFRQIYPASHWQLSEKILEYQGCLLTEFCYDQPIYKGNFLQRNRIIAGLSRATLITEAGLKSGAMITAYQALEYNRDVLAVPGDITRPQSAGTNSLLSRGAYLIDSPQALASYFNRELTTRASQTTIQNLDPIERQILNTLAIEPLHLNRLAERLNLDIVVLSSKVIMLEMKELVRRQDGGLYQLCINLSEL